MRILLAADWLAATLQRPQLRMQAMPAVVAAQAPLSRHRPVDATPRRVIGWANVCHAAVSVCHAAGGRRWPGCGPAPRAEPRSGSTAAGSHAAAVGRGT